MRSPACRLWVNTPVPTSAATNMSPTSVADAAPISPRMSCQAPNTQCGICWATYRDHRLLDRLAWTALLNGSVSTRPAKAASSLFNAEWA